MLRSLWTTATSLAVIALAALTLGADQPMAALMFSTLLCALAALALALPGARVSALGALWLLGGAALYVIGLVKGWASTGAAEYASLMAGAGVFMVARQAALKADRAEWLITLILSMGILLGFVGFVDFFLDPTTLFGLERAYHLDRLSAPFLSANTAATFYGLIGLLALASLLRALKRGGRVDARIQRLSLPATALLVCASCLFLSGSRAGISLFMLSALLLVAWDRGATWRARLDQPESPAHSRAGQGLWRTLAGPGALLILGLVVYGVSGGLYADRLAQGGILVGDDARGTMFTRYLQGIWLYPGLGSGLGSFAYINDFLAQADDAHLITSQNAAHNIAFQWLFQTGFIGALGALALMTALLLDIRKGLARRRSQTLILRAVLVVAAFVLAHGMVDYALEIPAVFWLFALVLGLGVGVAAGGTSGRQRSSAPGWLKIGVIGTLLLSAGLSLYAGLDRYSANSLAQMTDARFVAFSTRTKTLSGSPARLEAIGDRALRLGQPDLALARAAFLMSLDKEPRSGKVWAKLAYANYAIIPVMAGETETALRQSYYLLPYGDDEFRSWRLAFVAQSWNGLPEDLKSVAEREARILSRREAERWRRQVGIDNPEP